MKPSCTTSARKCSTRHHLPTVLYSRMQTLGPIRIRLMPNRTLEQNLRVYRRKRGRLTQSADKEVREEATEKLTARKLISLWL
jgi:hypothetical protein